jgi:co-chaperonin GroES (HSP10)
MELNLPKNFPQAIGKGVIAYPITEEETRTKGGLIIPDVATGDQNEQRKPKIAIIADVGIDVTKSVRDIHTGERRLIQRGDKVSINHYADTGFMFEANWYLQLHEEDVKTYFPDNSAKMMVEERPSRKRAAVQKAKRKYN